MHGFSAKTEKLTEEIHSHTFLEIEGELPPASNIDFDPMGNEQRLLPNSFNLGSLQLVREDQLQSGLFCSLVPRVV